MTFSEQRASATDGAFHFGGRKILVTGASSGIGRATAVLLSRLGATLVLTGRDEARLAAVRAELAGDGHVASAFDMANTDAIEAWFRELAGQTGPLSGMVCAAGIHSILPIRAVTPAQIDSLMRTNVYAPLMLAKCFAPKSRHAAPASIVFVASVAGLAGSSCLSVYSASKAALCGAARSLAVELAPGGIRVNAVAPGMVHSEMTERLREQLSDEQFAAIDGRHPLGIGGVADVANAIAFLLAEASGWITGTTMRVDGGYTAC